MRLRIPDAWLAPVSGAVPHGPCLDQRDHGVTEGAGAWAACRSGRISNAINRRSK